MEHEKINRLCREWTAKKAVEKAVKQAREKIEGEIAALLATKIEGTDSRKTDAFKVTVTSKLTRSLDYPAYQAIEDGLPDGIRCVDLKPTLNMKKYRSLEAVDPVTAAAFVTTKPAKTSVKVEPITGD